jgi:pantoate--beta-alanine ligase
MHVITSAEDLSQILDKKRLQSQIALVPTMGNIHEGHLMLIRAARKACNTVVVSLFVNPLQFNETEDYDAYPRTMDADIRLLELSDTDILFAPTDKEILPKDKFQVEKEDFGELMSILCGKCRPGHFPGVASIVQQLFLSVRPDVVIFGKKDYQQLIIVKKIAEKLPFFVEVVGVKTARTSSGLALSSRNAYLSKEEKKVAPELYASLSIIKTALETSKLDFKFIADQEKERLSGLGFKVEYLELRRSLDLGTARASDTRLTILVAAWLGKARLIDNVCLMRTR